MLLSHADPDCRKSVQQYQENQLSGDAFTVVVIFAALCRLVTCIVIAAGSYWSSAHVALIYRQSAMFCCCINDLMHIDQVMQSVNDGIQQSPKNNHCPCTCCGSAPAAVLPGVVAGHARVL